MSDPIYCQIQVKGHLSAQRCEWLGGLDIENRPDGRTMLRGRLVDQTALYCLIVRPRDLGVSMVSLACTESRVHDA